MPDCSFGYVTLPPFLSNRKRFGKNNVILSDIRKPPSNVFHSGESRRLFMLKAELCELCLPL